MVTPIPIPEELTDILDQAREVRERYPALYAYLTTRERAFDRARAAAPHPHDGEAWLTFNAPAFVRRHLTSIPPGVCELNRIADQRKAG